MSRLKVIFSSLVAVIVVIGGPIIWWAVGAREERPPLALDAQMPPIVLRPIEDIPGSGVDLSGGTGQMVLINAFASWCVPCREEHPILVEIAGRGEVTLVGINVSDLPENAAAFLAEMGNPYDMVGADPNREAFLDLGFAGLPQTVVVDSDGKILMNWPGPLTRRFIDDLLPKLMGDEN